MRFSIVIMLLLSSNLCRAQWNTTGDNTTSGRVIISGSTASTDYDDIVISRNKTDAGMRIFNANLAGRSVILFGNDFGGKYGFLAHHAASFNGGSGYSGTYKPSSTILSGGDVNGLGLISTSDIRFNAGGDHDAQQRMVIASNGQVTINQNLWVNNTATISQDVPDTDPGSSWNGALSVRNNNGAINTFSRLTFVSESGGFGTIAVKKTGDFTGDMFLQVRNGPGFYITPMLIKSNGYIGIGTASPDKALTVKGTVHANEVLVDLSVPGPDYVFEKNYDLLPLRELERYINQNKHLPEVPSAKEMEANGLELKEMNLLLLKKVEELTLHVIEQNKLIVQQGERIEKLESVNHRKN